MRTMTGVALVTVLTAAPVIPAAEPADVPALVAGLASPDYRVRERSAKALGTAGDRALPALRAALATAADPEAARRLAVLVRRLEADRLTAARVVTLKIEKQTAKAALEELSRAAGYPIQTNGLGDEAGRFSFDFVNAPFWKALDEICDAAGLTANPHDDGAVGVYFNDTFNPHVAYSGPFRIVATNINVSQGVQLSGLQRGRPFGRQPEYLNLNFQVTSEPKVPLIGIGQAVPVAARDDTGATMIPAPEPGQVTSYYPPQASYRTYSMGGGLNLTRSNRAATEVRSLKARVPILVLADVRPDVVVPDPLAAKGKRFSGREIDVEVTNAVEQNAAVVLTIALTRRDGPADDYGWMNGITQRFEVTDAKGKKLSLGSVDQNNSGPNACVLTLTFSGDGGKNAPRPARLVLVEWVTVTKDVEFEFQKLPLP